MFIVIVSVTSISREYKKKNSLVCCVRVCGINEVEKLLKDGLPPDCDEDNNQAEEGTMSAFTHACYGRNPENKVEIVKLLLDYGADIDVVSYCGFTPLFVAANSYESRSDEIVEYLIEQGADTQIECFTGETAAEFVRRKGNIHMSELINSYADEQYD